MVDLVTVGLFVQDTGGATGGGGAARTASGSVFLMGVSVKPLKWPQKSFCKPLFGGVSGL